MITIFKNIFSKEPHYISVSDALERIREGKSREQVEKIRSAIDKEKASELKKNLPSICFSGTFKANRQDDDLIQHSGYICLDFDSVFDCKQLKKELFQNESIKAVWISPSGNGVKALVNIADTKKHRQHFEALKIDYPQIDKSGINESRVCYESYDTEILIKETVKPYTKLIKIQKAVEKVSTDDDERFEAVYKWLCNRGDAFAQGERNVFIYKLASACCRFGIQEYNCISLISSNVISGGDFTLSEAKQTIKSAYKSNASSFNSVEFNKNELVDKITRSEVIITADMVDPNIKAKDVIFGIDVKQDAINLYRNGYESVESTGVFEVDKLFKFKRRELTLLTGIGNYGKSTWLKYLLVLQIVIYKRKIAIFTPEEAPAHEFYHDLTETYLGASCSIYNQDRPCEEEYQKAYDFITEHIFFIYPSELLPTPVYVKERFLELIFKEKVDFCIIDPFNQMTNDYGKGGRTDKYLETLLSDLGRFVTTNNIFFVIVAHPKMMVKGANGNYPCPDVFDVADGAMWNNKMDNILVYHLPDRQTDPQSVRAEFHTKKIRRRKAVGSIGVLEMEYNPQTRRFIIGGCDYLELILKKKEPEYKNYYEPKESIFLDEKSNSDTLPF